MLRALLKDIIIHHQRNVRLVEKILQTHCIFCWLANEWGWLWKSCLIAYPFNIYNLTFQVLLVSQINANPGRQTLSEFLTHILWCYTSSFENIKRIWYLLWEGGVYFAIRVNNIKKPKCIHCHVKVRWAILYFL